MTPSEQRSSDLVRQARKIKSINFLDTAPCLEPWALVKVSILLG